MKKTREQKGITLIALVITIVILLILAVVSINSIQNDGILSKARKVAITYNQSVDNEQEKLQNYIDYSDKVNGYSKWTQSGTSVTNGTVTLEVGTTVIGYTSPKGTTDPGWGVLGAEDGKLLLVSKTSVEPSVSLNGTDHLADFDNNGELDGIDLLNSICANYLNISLADSARSITVEDINRVTGYNPKNVGVHDLEQTGEGTYYGSGSVMQYGNEVTYTMNANGKVAYSSDIKSSNTSYITEFIMQDGTILTSDMTDGVKVTSNYYMYYPNTLTSSDSGDAKGIATDGKAYSLLFSNSTDGDSVSYWLASKYECASAGYTAVGFRVSCGDCLGRVDLWSSHSGNKESLNHGSRAVVSLKSNVNIDEMGKIS